MKTAIVLAACLPLLMGCATSHRKAQSSTQHSQEVVPLGDYVIGTWHRAVDDPEDSTVTFHSDGTWEGFTTDRIPEFLGGKPRREVMRGTYRVEGNMTFERATYTSSGEPLPDEEFAFIIDVISQDRHVSTAADGGTSHIYIRVKK